ILPVNLLFSLYRNIVSEQISAECAFNLSCSRFSAGCIKHHGFVKGVLLTGDRLTRCHVFIATETVPILFDNYSGKVIDDPEMY
ncbi:MAG: membrane protein insertion efficiency factor YidD, partial [Bacteroidota bacterium]|nr:membrane protein insertion efficiency factor YidD [Bacteroidota bacterium]